MSRLVMLDIDGVLNSTAFWKSADHRARRRQIDPIRVLWLNSIFWHVPYSIVVSSSWRHRGLKAMRATLREAGVRAPVIGLTPSLRGQERGNEIKAWLDASRRKIESYVILDDDDDMGELRTRLVRTDYHTGLTPEDAAKAVKLLGTPL